MDKNFNIFSQVKNEVQEFFQTKIRIAQSSASDANARYLQTQKKGYDFSQWETINLIDLYYNSKFESGLRDSEGQRKIFLNVCKFRSDVAAKQIDLDVKDFNFVPEEGCSAWDAFFMNRDFTEWAKENYFGELINTWVEKFPRYGWIVAKEVNGQLEDVPLQTIRNQQDAKSLNSAKYVIIEHPNMTLSEMKDMKGWNTDGLSMTMNEGETVYERYGHVPLAWLKKQNGETVEDGDESETVDALVITTSKKTTKDEPTGHVFFAEQISKRPFSEAHWTRQHGRLMGVGEIENQFENQIGANLSFNFYRRQLLWSSKKIFQSSDADGINKNLVRDVKDGDVLQVGTNGNISQVDMSNRASADFNNFSNILEKNSDQKSFTYEVATGASLPSGTPFRLGVVLSNAVNSHFDLKREKLGIFLKRGIIELILPTWKKTYSKEHLIQMYSDEEGFEALKQVVFQANLNAAIKEHLFAGKMPDIEALKVLVQQGLDKERYLAVTIPDDYYDSVKVKVNLTITGEEVDVPKKIETLTNLYTSMVQKGDPRADRILKRILAISGENFDLLAGAAPAPATPGAINVPGAAAPSGNPAIPSPMGMGANAPAPSATGAPAM